MGLRDPSAGRSGLPTRRRVLAFLAGTGIGNGIFARALAAQVAASPATVAVTAEMIEQAAWIAGLELTRNERALMREGLEEVLGEYRRLRAVPLDNAVAPALLFNPAPGRPCPPTPPARPLRFEDRAQRPADDDDLAFASLRTLGALLRSRQLTSEALTRLYLDRLARFDPALRCVITGTETLALEQARQADRELDAGDVRGPLHGIPWGAKDLIAVPGYRTTWGAAPYRDQVRPETATVAARLQQAGAVLVAKLSVGALAWGDVWFDGTTKNPWQPEQGASGSSAGSAAATAAGLVGFAIGTETLGSIVSPCTRCGASGLRPTFGRVSRHGVMALSWTMDKVGPIARSAEDCALVLDAIHGADPADPTAVDRAFRWPPDGDPRALRVGYVPELFDDPDLASIEDQDRRARIAEQHRHDRRTLDDLRAAGFELLPVALPAELPVGPLSFILTAEAACVFDELTRSGRDDQLVRQMANAWPNVWRQGQLIPAVEYLRANRIRSLLLPAMARLFETVDVYLTPTYGGDNLLLTNLTGHPQAVVPNGFRAGDGTPTSITFTGDLFGESALLAVADAYQRATGYHLMRPPLGTETG